MTPQLKAAFVKGVNDAIAKFAGIPKGAISAVHNPTVTARIGAQTAGHQLSQHVSQHGGGRVSGIPEHHSDAIFDLVNKGRDARAASRVPPTKTS